MIALLRFSTPMTESGGKKHAIWIAVGAVGALAAFACAGLLVVHAVRAHALHVEAPANEVAQADAGEADEEDEERAYAFRLPSGEPAALSCEEARRIVAQVRSNLAYEPDAVQPAAFASATADWLDPHALWSAASDSSATEVLEKKSGDLLAEIEGHSIDECAAAHDVGLALVKWVGELRAKFDHARETWTTSDTKPASEGAPFDDPAFTKPAADLAIDLGERVGAFSHALGPAGKVYVDAARERYFPAIDADAWARVVLAASVRAYVQLVDPHGAWAPLDEEESVYEVDLASRPPPRLWEKSERTAIGLRIGEGATPPLANGDLLLSLAGVTTAGLPLEQLDQLSFAAADTPEPATAVVLREGESIPRTLTMQPEDDNDVGESNADHDGITVERVPYGSGDALVIAVHDVRDDLGNALAMALVRERRAPRALAGVVLDLRGNGGGSTDGAIAALGLFLPGMPLFPMRRRDGTLETDRAPEPPAIERWNGPVATLVDSSTASAAEMIAGALAVYHRGPSVGVQTYGKGCAQEYVDDDAHAGVLRLTTLLYALPDGAPVQRVGITPTITISFTPPAHDSEPEEREGSIAHAAPTWRGPDVREHRTNAPEEAWGSNARVVGPCKDADVCRALRALAGASAKRTTPKH